MAATPDSDDTRRDATFVGRSSELALFQRAFDEMLQGRRRIVMLSGEPGIGKTRSAEAFAQAAEGQGALVLWGRCYEEPGAPPYWPWVQILREFVAASSPNELRLMMGPGMGRIAPLVPDLGAALGIDAGANAAPLEPGRARFWTFDAIAQFLLKVTRQVPLVLIIDNAHWADKASLALLEFLSHELLHSRLLVIATYRDAEVSHKSPLLGTLGELSRDAGVERARLEGLGIDAMAMLARAMLGAELPQAVITAIDRQTDGNPLFVIELLKVLLEESRDLGTERIAVCIPDGVRETIGRRLSRLPDACNELLSIASVIGRNFTGAELAAIASRELGFVLDSLRNAELAGIIEPFGDAATGYRFVHVLIRETLYDEIAPFDRMRLHGLAADALATLHAESELGLLSRLAHHYYESAALGNAGKAADYALRAADAAMLIDAYEDAVVHFGNVVRVLTHNGHGDDERIQRALFSKSRALLGIGDVAAAVELLIESVNSMGVGQDTAWLTDVLSNWIIMTSDRPQIAQLPPLRKVLALIPDGDSASRAKLLAAQAFAERTLGNHSVVNALVEKSVAMARRLGDDTVLCHCLRSSIFALRGEPASLERRLAFGREFLSTSPPSADSCEGAAEASYLQALNLLEAGRIDDLEALLTGYEKLRASRLGLHEYHVGALRIVVALLRGEYAGLEDRIEALLETGAKTRGDDAEGVYGAQMFTLNRDLGRLGTLAPVIEKLATAPGGRVWTPGLMLMFSELGMLEPARRELERLAMGGFAAVADDDMRATTLIYCAQTCAAIGDPVCAAELYELLLPYAGTLASHPATVCFGSTDLYLAMLAATTGAADAARGHFEAALASNTSVRAWPWVARTLYHYSALLRGSDLSEDRTHAERLLRDAEQLATSLGMEALAADVSKLLRGTKAGITFPDGLTVREVEVLRLIAIGRSNKDVSKVLSISLNTVATHVRNILTKTDCANRTEAAAYAMRTDLLDSPWRTTHARNGECDAPVHDRTQLYRRH